MEAMAGSDSIHQAPSTKFIPLSANSNVDILVPPAVRMEEAATLHVLATKKSPQGDTIEPWAVVATLPCEKNWSDAPSQKQTQVNAFLGDECISSKLITPSPIFLKAEAFARERRVRRAQLNAAKKVLAHMGVSKRDSKKIARQMSTEIL